MTFVCPVPCLLFLTPTHMRRLLSETYLRLFFLRCCSAICSRTVDTLLASSATVGTCTWRSELPTGPCMACLYPGRWYPGCPVACSALWTSGSPPPGLARLRSLWACWSWWRTSSTAHTAAFWSATSPRRTLVTPTDMSSVWLTPERWFLRQSSGAPCGRWGVRRMPTACTGWTAGHHATCLRSGAGRSRSSQTWQRRAAHWRTTSCVGRHREWERSWRGSCTPVWPSKVTLDRWTWSTRLSSTTWKLCCGDRSHTPRTRDKERKSLWNHASQLLTWSWVLQMLWFRNSKFNEVIFIRS